MKSKGTIFQRKIANNDYYYHQYLEEGKLKSKTITEIEAYHLAFNVYFQGEDLDAFLNHKFNLEIAFGEDLHSLGGPSPKTS